MGRGTYNGAVCIHGRGSTSPKIEEDCSRREVLHYGQGSIFEYIGRSREEAWECPLNGFSSTPDCFFLDAFKDIV